MESHMIGRYVLVGALLVAMAAAAAWFALRGGDPAQPPLSLGAEGAPAAAEPGAAPAEQPGSEVPAEPSEVPAATEPTGELTLENLDYGALLDAPEAEREAALALLRPTDRFIGLAEASRARDYPFTGYRTFAPMMNGVKEFEWRNKQALWDSVMPSIRDDALLGGRPTTDLIWPDIENAIETGIDMTWPDRVTGGRGQYVRVRVRQELQGKPVLRVWGVMIRTDNRRRGAVTTSSHIVDIARQSASSGSEAFELMDRYGWQWVLDQPRTAASGSGDAGTSN